MVMMMMMMNMLKIIEDMFVILEKDLVIKNFIQVIQLSIKNLKEKIVNRQKMIGLLK